MTTPEALLRKWLKTHPRTDFNRELIEETEKWLGDVDNLPSVAGRMEMTHEAFQRACQVHLMRLQEFAFPDNGLVHTLCEAVRCSRECCEIAVGSESKHKIDTQSTRIRELEVQVEWRPIDTAPKDGTRLLLLTDGICDVGYWSTSEWVSLGGSWIIYETRSDTIELKPSHWMPLPPAPTTTQKG